MRSGRPGCGVRPHRPSHRRGPRTYRITPYMTGIWVRFIQGEWQWVFTLQFLKINIYQTASLQTKAVHSTDYSHGLPRAGPLGPGPRLLPDALLHACRLRAPRQWQSAPDTPRHARAVCTSQRDTAPQSTQTHGRTRSRHVPVYHHVEIHVAWAISVTERVGFPHPLFSRTMPGSLWSTGPASGPRPSHLAVAIDTRF